MKKSQIPKAKLTAKKDRWVNWDKVIIEGDDLWETVESLEEKRQQQIREQQQMEKIRRAHEKRLDNITFDKEDYLENEPYSFMSKTPALA